MMDVLIKGGDLETDRHGEKPCKHKGRQQADASTSQGMPETASKPPEASREAWDSFPRTALRKTQGCHTSILEFLLPELAGSPLLLFESWSLWYFGMAALRHYLEPSLALWVSKDSHDHGKNGFLAPALSTVWVLEVSSRGALSDPSSCSRGTAQWCQGPAWSFPLPFQHVCRPPVPCRKSLSA